VDENEDGIATSVKGIQWEALSVKNLRTICARLGFKGYKNANKHGIIDIIVKCCKAKMIYDSLWDDHEKDANGTTCAMLTRKETQCVLCFVF
jgi:hypothetical protein